MRIKKTATFDLYLHGGKAPKWLVPRMKRLGKAILEVLLLELGPQEIISRLADPFWFQAFSYVLGYDWDSSGVTTVLTGVLKSILSPEMALMIAGGKGKRALDAPREIIKIGEIFGFSSKRVKELIRISRLVAKVDNAVIQDGHQLYHHAMMIDKEGNWAIIQQGMNTNLKTARRYHWVSSKIRSFVVDPHAGIIGHTRLPFVLNMASKDSIEGQRVSIDLVNEGPQRIQRDLSAVIRSMKRIPDLGYFMSGKRESKIHANLDLTNELRVKIIRNKVNWKSLERAYELSPKTYEDLILIRGIGPSTIRALALISELIYNADISWRDPIRYTFAVGGKDGVPYPVNIKRMEEISEFLADVIKEARLGNDEKLALLRRLSHIYTSLTKIKQDNYI